MAAYNLKKEQRAFAFDRTITPVLEIASGDIVTFETGDVAYERLSKGETVEAIGLENFNAVTGPVFVNDAQPSDALKVEILDVQAVRAWSVWLPDFGGMGKWTNGQMDKRSSGERNSVTRWTCLYYRYIECSHADDDWLYRGCASRW